MTSSDNSLKKLMEEAERLGKEQTELEERNRKRRAKGRKPLPDAQERKDMEVGRKRYRTADSTVVDAADAMKLFEMRKAEMLADSGDDDLGDDEEAEMASAPVVPPASPVPPVSPAPRANKSGRTVLDEDVAIKEAEAARRIQDLKNGRVDHDGTWSSEGAQLEGGDKTVIVDKAEIGKAWGIEGVGGGSASPEAANEPQKGANGVKGVLDEILEHFQADEKSGKGGKGGKSSCDFRMMGFISRIVEVSLGEFRKDMYERMRVSFDALERTLSDLQGRVSEIVTASGPSVPDGVDEGGFQELLSRKMPVVFDVGGTLMTFDAITVFHAPPCITVVSKIGSAKITPKPGAQLLLTYEMDGQRYVNDPVTFLGTRFDLPMFGLSFVGFIRDNESDMIDTAAGIEGGEAVDTGGAE